MRHYKGLRDELARLREGAEELGGAEQSISIVYDAAYLRVLPEQEQEAYLQGLVVQKRAEQEALKPNLRSRIRQQVQADTEVIIFFPIKNSYTVETTEENKPCLTYQD